MLRLIALLLLLPCMANAAAKKQNPIEDLWYGHALYFFYLQQPFDALSLLAVREEKHGSDTQFVPALLLETILKLDYGMALSAQVLVDKPEVSEALKNHDMLWLHLANAFYQKQWFNLSQAALSRIDAPTRLNDYANFLYLNAQLAFQNKDFNTAQLHLKKLNKQSVYHSYVQYNVAISHFQQDQSAPALQLLDRIIANQINDPYSAERQHLQQYALVTAAYVSLLSQQADRAESYFGRLNRDSIFADSALFGFGQAMFERQQYDAAMRLWQQLDNYPHAKSLQIRAQLALSRLHETQNNFTDALSHAENAAQLSAHYAVQLRELAGRFDAQQLAALLIDSEQIDNQIVLLHDLLPLTDLFSSSDFKAQLDNIRDLQAISKQLNSWKQQMALMDMVSQSRIQLFEQKSRDASALRTQFSATDIALEADALRDELRRIEHEKDVFALNNPEENRLLRLIARSETLLPALDDDPFLEEYIEALRRTKGAMLWQAYQHYHARLWQAKSALQDLERELLQNTKLNQDIDTHLNNQAYYADLNNNVARQAQLISTQQAELDALYQEALAGLYQSFQHAVEQEQQSNTDLLKDARVHVARLSEHFLDENLP